MLKNLKSQNTLAACTARVNQFQNPPFIPEKEAKWNGRGFIEVLYTKDIDSVLYDIKRVFLFQETLGEKEIMMLLTDGKKIINNTMMWSNQK